MCSLEKRGNIYILTLTGVDDEHRLNPNLISTVRSYLARIRSESSSSTFPSALVTTAEGKFFSNGFDLAWARKNATSTTTAYQNLFHMTSLLIPLVADFISLPMPTVAAVTGHASAAGFMIAICHDYITMRADRGVLYMSELDIGLSLPEYFMALMKAKIGDRRVLRDVTLRAKKMVAKEASERGIVDVVGEDARDTLEKAVRMAEELVARKWNGDVYAEIRMGAFPELCEAVGLKGERKGVEEKKGLDSKL